MQSFPEIELSAANDPSRIWARRPNTTFTGEVWSEPRITSAENLVAQTVQFMPSCRTFWHRHENGQILIVTAGRGYLGTRDGQVREIAAGDVIWTPPNIDHYHGALDNSFLMHYAISLGTTQWLEEVKDEDYGIRKA